MTADVLSLALEHQKAGRLSEAERLYRQILVAEPENVNALHLLGTVACEQGSEALAIECITRAIQLAPNFAEAHYNLGRALQRQGKTDDAIASYLQALQLKPDYAEACSNLALALESMGKAHEAEKWFRRAVEIKPNNAEAQHRLGNVLRNQEYLDEAIAAYQRAVALDAGFAPAWSDLANALWVQGSIDQAIACQARAVELWPKDPKAHNNLGTLYKEQGKIDQAIACYEQAINLESAFAEAHFNLGLAYFEQRNLDKAIKSYARAIELRPNFPQAYYEMGNVYETAGRIDDALGSYRRALDLNPSYAEALNNLGAVYQQRGDLEQAMCAYRRALENKPNLVSAHNNLGTILRERGQFDAAAAAFRGGIELAPNESLLHSNLAGIMLLQGDFERGWHEYEFRTKRGKFLLRQFVQPQWRGESLAGKTILLYTEQGLGDTLQFIRYAPLIKRLGATVAVECQPPLTKLLARSPGIDILLAEGEQPPPIDFHSPLVSLPAVFRTTLSTIPSEVPYVVADPALVEHWKCKLDKLRGLRIGINWHGRGGKRESRLRDIPLTEFALLGQIAGVQLISLQKGPGQHDLAAARGQVPIIDLGELDTEHGAFMDTAAIMKNLDLVITSDTSIAHLAGALAVPVWVALAFPPEWRWLLDRRDSPWYPTMRLFRQTSPGDWTAPFAEITAHLKERLPAP